VVANLLNARRKPANRPRPRACWTFGSWIHILVNGKLDLQNSWRCFVFLLLTCSFAFQSW
jgi:hypothetical protein